MERTEKLMMKAIVRYREDRDLENAIDFVQKKVTNDFMIRHDLRQSQWVCRAFLNPVCCVCSFSAVEHRAIRTGPRTSTLSVRTLIPVWRPVEFPSPAASASRTRSEPKPVCMVQTGLSRDVWMSGVWVCCQFLEPKKSLLNCWDIHSTVGHLLKTSERNVTLLSVFWGIPMNSEMNRKTLTLNHGVCVVSSCRRCWTPCVVMGCSSWKSRRPVRTSSPSAARRRSSGGPKTTCCWWPVWPSACCCSRFVISSYADDILLYLSKPEQSLPALLEKYGAVAGYKVNWGKTEVMYISTFDRNSFQSQLKAQKHKVFEGADLKQSGWSGTRKQTKATNIVWKHFQ